MNNQLMGYVDLVDYEKFWRIFLGENLFQTFYKKGFLGILDSMLVNGQVAWNMSADASISSEKR